MAVNVDIAQLLAPIPGANPTGEDLRYTTVYDEIREARRSDDPTHQGEWEREVKCSDWKKVISTSIKALTEKTKDLQIAVWLAEALTMTEGFEGFSSGMTVLVGLHGNFFDDAYPRIEDDDYDSRVALFEFLNDKFSSTVRQIPLTDPRVTTGYSFLKWQESRDVGYESEAKKEQREVKLSEGKITAEEFDTAVAKSPAVFYKTLADSISSCLQTFRSLDTDVDKKYGRHAPRLSDLGQALEECHRLVMKVCREQKGLKDALEVAASESPTPEAPGDLPVGKIAETASEIPALGMPTSTAPSAGSVSVAAINCNMESQETQIWNEALMIMQKRGLKEALNLLLAAANSQSSERGRNRYRFLVAKLCLKGGRPELARPIVEQLNTKITELQLEKWECPFWISEILEALYQCLISGENGDEDASRAKELFKKICTMDVTKALG